MAEVIQFPLARRIGDGHEKGECAVEDYRIFLNILCPGATFQLVVKDDGIYVQSMSDGEPQFTPVRQVIEGILGAAAVH